MASSSSSFVQQNASELEKVLKQASFKAGSKILEIYQRPAKVMLKGDGSPVTEADQAAEAIILAELNSAFPKLPVLAEESYAQGDIPNLDEIFFLVDPLDGTKEFVRKNGEFTVNIALIEHGIPTCGIVFAPALGCLYFGGPNGAYKLDCALQDGAWVHEPPQLLKVDQDREALNVVASRSHPSEGLGQLFDYLPIKERVSAGSSLKFCMIAEARAHLYPRLTPTMEWDTGAGQAVLKAAGGVVTRLSGDPLDYNKVETGYLNPFFIAANSMATAKICADAFDQIPEELVIR